MGKKIFYAHAGSGNHGCEAIVRASSKILGNDIVLYSMNPEQDRKYGIQDVVSEIKEDKDSIVKKYSFPWFASRVQTKLTGSINREIYNRKKAMFDDVSSKDIVFSIGGDNYCYQGTDILGAENSLFRSKGAKTVLWGCSVEPKLIQNENISKDLASYNLVVVRESISYEALKKINNNTILVPDPAFLLKRKDLSLPDGWIEGKMVGINASPLIMQNAKDGKLAYEAYQKLIQYVIEKTPYSVALIPHVVWESNDDREPLTALYNDFKQSGKVVLLQDYNCEELKGYIARCRFFVGARTHSTIAAYSSCVPTVVLGYSVKSRGIACDLFGTDENYVLPVQNLQKTEELVEAFTWLQQNEITIREHLENIMPEYIARTYQAKNFVEGLR